MKARYATLAESLQRSQEEVARQVGRIESERGDLRVFADELSQAVSDWRSRTGS
jgi:hypothetical protein